MLETARNGKAESSVGGALRVHNRPAFAKASDLGTTAIELMTLSALPAGSNELE